MTNFYILPFFIIVLILISFYMLKDLLCLLGLTWFFVWVLLINRFFFYLSIGNKIYCYHYYRNMGFFGNLDSKWIENFLPINITINLIKYGLFFYFTKG